MKKIFRLIIVMIMIILFLFIKLEVSAYTNYSYIVCFDYSCTYVYNTSSKTISSGYNVESVVVPDSKGEAGYFSISLYGNEDSNFDVLNNDGYLNSTEIEIVINSEYIDYELYLYDGFGNLIESSGSNYIYVDDMIEDAYYFEAKCSGEGNNIDGRSYEMYYTECSFYFNIDTTKPTVVGASDGMDGKYTNSSFYVYGKDDYSGIKNIYMLEPGSDSYQNIGQEIKLSSSKNGLITFYAVDNAGNISSLYYIYNDITKPSGVVKNEDEEIIKSSYTDSSFYYEGKDSNSGVGYMQYLLPNETYWNVYDGQIISKTSSEGLYQFRTIDKSGNISDVVSVYLYTTKSNVEVVHINNSNKLYLTWENDEFEVLLNLVPYQKNQIISEEGEYEAVIKNKFGVTSNLSFTITCYFELTKIYEANCLNDGYTLYTCMSCGKEIRSDFITNGTHIYNEYFVEPTCAKEGGVYHYCIVCEEDYMTDIVAPLGHTFNNYIVNIPTCNLDGKREFSCIYCQEIKVEVIPKKGHQYKLVKEQDEFNEIMRIYQCELCDKQISETMEKKNIELFISIQIMLDQYSKYIIWIILITSGVWSICLGVRIIFASKNDEREKVKRLIVYYIVGIITIFVVLVAIPYLIKVML